MRRLDVNALVTAENFVEADYLEANRDVADAVRAGHFASGRAHFDKCGYNESRRQRLQSGIEFLRKAKIANVECILRNDMPCSRRGLKYDFLTPGLRASTGISETDAISLNGYDKFVEALIDEFADGIVLDCGAGQRPVYYDNVVNYEIVDYDTTDIIGVGERLPFLSESLDAVISIAVLEHVRDPFACAKEISRVLKRGGKLICSVPFLQPEHGYPHHYFNMAPQGLKSLFDQTLLIDDHKVIESILPVWTLTWFLQSWASGLAGAALDDFRSLRVGELVDSIPPALLEKPWVRQLSSKKNFELASATVLFAHKA